MGIGRSSRLNGSRTNPKPSSVVTPISGASSSSPKMTDAAVTVPRYSKTAIPMRRSTQSPFARKNSFVISGFDADPFQNTGRHHGICGAGIHYESHCCGAFPICRVGDCCSDCGDSHSKLPLRWAGVNTTIASRRGPAERARTKEVIGAYNQIPVLVKGPAIFRR